MKNFKELSHSVVASSLRKRLVVTSAADEATRTAVARALEELPVEAIFVGSRAEVEADTRLRPWLDGADRRACALDADSLQEAAARSVALIRSGSGDILVKGLINTDILLRAILDRDTGILPPGRLLTHIAVAEIPACERLLYYTDAAVIPFPTHEQRRQQVAYIAEVARRCGVEEPRIALIHCTEKVDVRHFPVTEGYPALKAEGAEGAFGRCRVDGPLDLKTSCSPEALAAKGLHSCLEGRADALVFPDIESANLFHKTVTLFCDATVASMLVGTDVPVVLTSRGDSAQSKFASILIACKAR